VQARRERNLLRLIAELGQERDQRASQHGAYLLHGGEQAERWARRIGGNDLDQALVKQVESR